LHLWSLSQVRCFSAVHAVDSLKRLLRSSLVTFTRIYDILYSLWQWI
jgi:hypothetical protein